MKQGLNQSNVFVINSMFGETVPLSVTSTSSNVTFALPQSVKNYDCIVTNGGASVAFINFGIGSSTVATVPGTTGTTGAFPVLPGEVVTLQKNSDAVKNDTCAAICNTGGSTTLYFTSVQGS